MANNTFFAKLEISVNGRTIKMDCRPSDGIALALRMKGKIFVMRKVFEESGISWPPKEGEIQAAPREEPL